MNKPLFLAAASLLLLGAGCLPTPKNLIENAVEKKINAELGSEGDLDIKGNTISFKDENGAAVNIGENVKLPDDFPKDLPMMDGAMVSGSAVSPDGAWAIFSVSSSSSEVISWYEAKLKADGWAKYGSTSSAGQETSAFTKADAWINVVVSTEEGKTMVTVTKATQK